MNNAIILFSVMVIITALTGLIFYAHRAGHYAEQIFEAKEQKTKHRKTTTSYNK